jgi:outer membrane protein
MDSHSSLGRQWLWLMTCLALAAPVAAQGPPASEGLEVSLGVGVISSPRPYVGADDQLRVIPLIEFASERFYVRGVTAGARLIAGGRFDLDLIGRFRFAGLEAGDSAFLAGMAARRETMEMGLSAVWDLGRVDLQATATRDALGRSDGSQAGLEVAWSKVFGRGAAGLFPAVGVAWQDANFVDYYAGVRAEEERPGRPAFEAGGALNPGVRLAGFAKVTDRVRLVGLLRVERLGGGYERSPIIESRWSYFGLLGLAYDF